MPRSFNSVVRSVLLGARWAMAPLCLGLIAALLLVVAQFVRELWHAVGDFPGMHGREAILAVLKLVDLVLVANLVVMIIGAGVEIFLPADESAHPADGPAGFAALKPRLFASISAIAAIDLLESFVNIDPADKTGLFWDVTILLVFVVAGLLLALMERLDADRH